MNYEIDSLKTEIRIALDENMSSVRLTELGDIDTLSLDDLIKSKIADAARIVEQSAPREMLEQGTELQIYRVVPGEEDSEYLVKNITEGTISYGRIDLPDDFLRFLSLTIQKRPIPATEAISEQDPMFIRQFSKYPGIRGNPLKPVVAIIRSKQGGSPILAVFPHDGTDNRVTSITYLPIPSITTINSNEVIDISKKLKPAVVYYAGYLVALSIQQKELAAYMQSVAKDLAGLSS